MSDLAPLIAAAREALEAAYAPYSGHRVGAALRGVSGTIYSGCNVENAAYPQGLCAEAAALAAMVRAGEQCFVEVVVLGEGAVECTPCGGCRQKLWEFGDADAPVHVCGPEGLRSTYSLGDLLPRAFGRENLR